MKRIHLTMAVAAALFLFLAPSALAEAPEFLQNPSIDILQGTDHSRTPPAVPKVGDTLWGNNGSPSCHPTCDPNGPDPRGPGAVILAGAGPRGQFFSWFRCNIVGCAQVQERSTTVNTYVIKPEDAGSQIQFVVSLTNLDCGEVVREGPNAGFQECRYTTTNATALTEQVLPNAIVAVDPDALPNPSVGELYNAPLTAKNGTGPYGFTLKSGTLPPGLSLAPSGVINGTPTTAGTYTFTVQATGAGASPGTKSYTLTVGLGMPTLANGVTGVAYTQPLSAAGATGAVAYAVTAGALPDGLSLSGAQLVGTPSKQGTFAFTLRGTDASGAAGSKQYTLTINFPTLLLTPTALGHAVRGVDYREILTVSGGSAPYAFALTSGVLPAGLSLRANGEIVGIPTSSEPNTFQFTITAHDKYGAPVSVVFTLEYLAPEIEVAPTSLLPAVVGEKVRIKLRAAGGNAPYTFSLVSGKLPTGLKLGRAGVIAGRPKQAGVFRFVVRAIDEDGAFANVRLRMTVRAAV